MMHVEVDRPSYSRHSAGIDDVDHSLGSLPQDSAITEKKATMAQARLRLSRKSYQLQ